MRSRRIVAGLAMALTVACGSSGASSPTPTPSAVDSRGTFTLSGAGYDGVTQTFSNAGGNLVFCRHETPGPDTLWIRLASSPAANGDTSPHVDIDLCHFAGTGTFSTPHDTSGARTCSQGASVGVWWHDGAREFASIPASSPCTVSVTQGAGVLEGTFECRGLEPHGTAGDHLDVTSGSFRCAL
jgi:hypothetical protein